jgi:mutator family transposase
MTRPTLTGNPGTKFPPTSARSPRRERATRSSRPRPDTEPFRVQPGAKSYSCQRGLAHRMRNLRGKVPDAAWPDVAIRARACDEAASPALTTVLRDDVVQVYERDLPAAVRCFLDDFEAGIAHLRFPLRHRKGVRTTNLLEPFSPARTTMARYPASFGCPISRR